MLTMFVSIKWLSTCNPLILFNPSAQIKSHNLPPNRKQRKCNVHKLALAVKKPEQWGRNIIARKEVLPAKNLAFSWSPSSFTIFSCIATNAAAQRIPTCLIPPPNVFLSRLAWKESTDRFNKTSLKSFAVKFKGKIWIYTYLVNEGSWTNDDRANRSSQTLR